MGMTLLAAFQTYIQKLKPISRKDKEYAFELLCHFLSDQYGQAYVSALMQRGDTDAWAVITKESVESFIIWQAQQNFTFQTIVVRTNGMRKLFEIAARAKCLSRQTWEGIKGLNVSGAARSALAQRASSAVRLTTRKTHRLCLTPEQVHQLKRQPDTPQGRRDALLVCLLVDQHCSCQAIASLPVSALDVEQGTLQLSNDEVVLLSNDTREAARRYLTLDHPEELLLQGSRKNQALHGHMSVGGIAGRVRFLGKRIGIASLSPQDCQYWDRPSLGARKAISTMSEAPVLEPNSIVQRPASLGLFCCERSKKKGMHPMEVFRFINEAEHDETFGVYIKAPDLLPADEEKQPRIRLLVPTCIIMECPRCTGYGIVHEDGFRCGNKDCGFDGESPVLETCPHCTELANIVHLTSQECVSCGHYYRVENGTLIVGNLKMGETQAPRPLSPEELKAYMRK